MWSLNFKARAKRHPASRFRQALRLLLAVSGLLIVKPAAAADSGKDPGMDTGKDCPQAADAVSTQELFDQFKGPGLNGCDWIEVQKNWGGRTETGDYNGGVIRANVAKRDDRLVLTARGNRYDGEVRGYNSDGTMRPDGRRTGAVIMSRQRYLGGRFEARVTIPPDLGVASALWTFFYAERDGAVENHEIDIEFPGRPSDDAAPSLRYALFSTWRGLLKGEWTTVFKALPETATVTDGNFHVLRFDWRPPDAGSEGSVAFYIDGQLLETIRKDVPSKPGNLWLGLWFPRKWAGVPDFSTAEMTVDWVRITPLQ
jgi:beta-glucanase (GH16 family)